MSLRTKFGLYWVLLHAAFGVSMFVLLKEKKEWLLVVELLLLVSLIIAFRLLYLLHKPLQLVQQGVELVRENFASASFSLTGNREVDSILETYNVMLSNLQKERQRMQEQHYLLEKIIAASPSGIITLDFDDRISMVNPKACKFLGNDFEGLRNKPLHQLSEQFASKLSCLKEGESATLTLDSRSIIRCTRSSFFDQGFPRGFLLMEELTEEFLASEKAAFEKAIRVLSHEVNNSIGAANSLLHSLLFYKDQLKPEDQPDFEMALNVVISRTDHLNNFMQSYVRIIRLQEPDLMPVELKKLVENTVHLFDSELVKREINVEWRWQENINLIVNLDQVQMGQVLVNIIKNAIEAIDSQGRIIIRLADKPKSYRLEISDSGGGVPEEIRSNLFSPFFSSKQNGQGIGLALVQEILHRHYFKFNLINCSSGFTTFFIEFPKQ